MYFCTCMDIANIVAFWTEDADLTWEQWIRMTSKMNFSAIRYLSHPVTFCLVVCQKYFPKQLKIPLKNRDNPSLLFSQLCVGYEDFLPILIKIEAIFFHNFSHQGTKSGIFVDKKICGWGGVIKVMWDVKYKCILS